jgi:hypothetical protein
MFVRRHDRRGALIAAMTSPPRCAATAEACWRGHVSCRRVTGAGVAGRKIGGDGQRLWNLACGSRSSGASRARFEGRSELIDHLLVSHALVHQIDSVDTASDVPSITADPAARKDMPGSDHAMVFAHLSIG